MENMNPEDCPVFCVYGSSVREEGVAVLRRIWD
jgi:hypothetical protein